MRGHRILLLILVFLALQLLILRKVQAEYRVYKLGVKYDEKQKTETEVLTTLDNLQYVSYYKFTPTQQTRLIDHWMCHGRTDNFKKYCSKPIVPNIKNPAPLAAQAPASPTGSLAQASSASPPAPTAPTAVPSVPVTLQ